MRRRSWRATDLSPRFGDPDDDYLVALALATGSLLASGDKDLLSVEVEHVEVLAPAEAAARLFHD